MINHNGKAFKLTQVIFRKFEPESMALHNHERITDYWIKFHESYLKKKIDPTKTGHVAPLDLHGLTLYKKQAFYSGFYNLGWESERSNHQIFLAVSNHTHDLMLQELREDLKIRIEQNIDIRHFDLIKEEYQPWAKSYFLHQVLHQLMPIYTVEQVNQLVQKNENLLTYGEKLFLIQNKAILEKDFTLPNFTARNPGDINISNDELMLAIRNALEPENIFTSQNAIAFKIESIKLWTDIFAIIFVSFTLEITMTLGLLGLFVKFNFFQIAALVSSGLATLLVSLLSDEIKLRNIKKLYNISLIKKIMSAEHILCDFEHIRRKIRIHIGFTVLILLFLVLLIHLN
jgi:hypothetical protein